MEISAKIKVPDGRNIVSSPLLNVDFSFTDALENKLNSFFGLYGDFQKFIDESFIRGVWDYMPFDTGTMRNLTREQTQIGSGLITTDVPQARFLYYGLVMVDTETGSTWSPLGGKKKTTDRPLKYHGGGKDGAFWDKRFMAEKGDDFVAELKEFVKEGF